MTDVFPSPPAATESPQARNSVRFPALPSPANAAREGRSGSPNGPENTDNRASTSRYASPAASGAYERKNAPSNAQNEATGDLSVESANAYRQPSDFRPNNASSGPSAGSVPFPNSTPAPTTGSIQFPNVFPTEASPHDSTRWHPRRGSLNTRSGHQNRRRSRAKSLSEQTQDAVRVVAPPISVSLVLLCFAWYLSSAVSNNLSKSILQIFAYPVTITMLQFVYAALFSFGAALLARRSAKFANLFPRNTVSARGIVGPEAYVLRSTGPMAGFQIVGHILSLSATASIPVSLVHAIKSLSPLLTVGVYTFVFGVRYNWSTYVSLVPLTAGVIMACAAEFRARPLAILYAFLSCVVFVSQNIWSKALLTTGHAATAEKEEAGVSTAAPRKLDKLTIIFWCAAMGFLGTLPIWLLSDGALAWRHGFTFASAGTAAQFWFLVSLNGFTHFCQNLLSFMILGGISTVSYSIASLLKRIFVMTAAIFWFGQSVSAVQGWGIVITFTGLYIYDRFGSKAPEPKPLPR